MSRRASTRSFLSLVFSASSSFSDLASDVSIKPNLARYYL